MALNTVLTCTQPPVSSKASGTVAPWLYVHWKAACSLLLGAIAKKQLLIPRLEPAVEHGTRVYFVFLVCSRYCLRIPTENEAEGALQVVKPTPVTASATGTRAWCSSNVDRKTRSYSTSNSNNSCGQAARLDAQDVTARIHGNVKEFGN